MAAVAGDATRLRNNLPPAVVLPDRLVHYSGRVPVLTDATGEQSHGFRKYGKDFLDL